MHIVPIHNMLSTVCTQYHAQLCDTEGCVWESGTGGSPVGDACLGGERGGVVLTEQRGQCQMPSGMSETAGTRQCVW